MPLDTTAAAERLQLEALRKLGAEGRLKLAFDLSETLRAIVMAGIQRRHPDYDRKMICLAYLRIILGNEQFRRILPDAEIEP